MIENRDSIVFQGNQTVQDSNKKKGKVAWVAGATGLVGGHLISELCSHDAYDKVIAFVRRTSEAQWTEYTKVEQWVVNYEHLKAPDAGYDVDDVFCALGTTRKKTPDSEAYHRIDVEYPQLIAKLGLEHGAGFYGVVSAHGASPKALSSYFRMKGEMEHKLQKLAYEKLAIARPGMLKGNRGEFRLMEKVGEFFTDRLPGNYRTIAAGDVAAALILAANEDFSGTRIMNSSSMQGAHLKEIELQTHD